MHAFINGGNIYYIEKGDAAGLPVIFLHGFPFSHEMWKEQLELVGASYRTIAYDIRGHGLSDIGDGQYTIEGHVDDLIALLDHLKIQKTVIVGLSMGGYITLRALQRNPERFMGAVLCDTRAEGDTDEGKIRRFAGVKGVKEGGSAQFADGFVKAVFAPESFERKKDAVAMIRAIIGRTPPLSIAGTLIALAARTDTSSTLGTIGIPTLILVGESDQITPPDASRAMHVKIKGAEIHLLPRAAHMSNLENPEAFNGHLTDFLKHVSGMWRT